MKLRIRLPQNEKLNRTLKILGNKYILTTLIFIVWISFFDGNSLLERATVANKTSKMEREAMYYEKMVKDNKQRLQELRTDNNNLEKYAREQYLMKRNNEDIFIVVE